MAIIMDILKIFHEKLYEIGEDAMCKELGLARQIVRQFKSGKKTPSFKSCQKILDLWGKSYLPQVEAEKVAILEIEKEKAKKDNEDGSIADFHFDSLGILNASFCPAEWGLKKKAWEGRDVCLCLPIIDSVPQPTVYSWMALVAKYRQALRYEMRGDDSDITRSRNHLAKRFLNTGATWSIWFDSDMVFPVGHAGIYATMTNMKQIPEKYLGYHTIERLISWNKTIVGGCYWDRRGGGKLIAGGNQPILHAIPSDTIQGIAFVGTGCLAIHRQVFLDIASKFPETMSNESLGNECGFFTQIQTPQRMLGEDESFAKRATDAGHPTFLDLGLLCGHIGCSNIHGIPANGSKM